MSDLGDIHDLREETYQRKLRENIELKERFIDAGLSNLSKIPIRHEDDDDEVQSLKREAISLYESLKTVPFKPQRDDLIGISLADRKLEQQVGNLKSAIKLTREVNDDKLKDLKYIQSLIFNLNLLNNLMISKERTKDVHKDADDGSQLDLDAIVESLETGEMKLIANVEEVVFKYLVDLNSYGDDKRNLKIQYLKLMEDLLNNITNNGNEFVEIPIELQNDSILRQLLVGHVILQRDNFKFIKLNGFGL